MLVAGIAGKTSLKMKGSAPLGHMSVGGKADLRGGAGAGLSIRWGDKSKPASEYKCLPTCLRNTVIYRIKFCPRQLEIKIMSGGNYFVMFFGAEQLRNLFHQKNLRTDMLHNLEIRLP